MELKVSVEQESVWLNRNQIAELFGRDVKRDIEYYNLDVIISVGYRVKSQEDVRFRQWATTILKNYIQNGYAINHHKITEQRLFELENDMRIIKSKIKDNSRFLIIDKKEVYHLGVSIKDLGKKWFAFSKFELDNLKILEKLSP